ncbi:hypothetical protein SH661x_000408 [Planctomicrobium sp. SH661]|uniref:hypothetical protein n=1 Tax=Planctomicrobium sp. SH661 TaxID=3448124 RepID=UPI003F5BA148
MFPALLRKFLLPLILSLLSGGFFLGSSIEVPDPDAVTPVEDRFGWCPPSLADQEMISNSVPPFAIQDAPSWGSAEGAVVHLWDYARAINGGKHLPTYYQETGDCVSMGYSNAVNYLQAVQIAVHGASHQFRSVFQPYNYGVSRTAKECGAGKLGRSAGSNGSWAVRAGQLYGNLPADLEGVPKYSGSLADSWGYKGPPEEFFAKAEAFKLTSFAKVTTYEQVRDAIANGYPVTVASNQGFAMKQKLIDGKMVATPSGSWAHQMCFIGVDDVSGHVYCLNSWGENAHSKPAGDEPPGGFWVDKRTVNRMVGQGDSFALSMFDGFPYRPLNFDTFLALPPGQADVIDLPEIVPQVPACRKYLHMRRGDCQCAGQISGFLSLFSGTIAAFSHSRSRRRSSRDIVA